MTKLALIGLITVCITVLCFTLLRHERLCSFNISSGNTLVQANLSCDNSFVGNFPHNFSPLTLLRLVFTSTLLLNNHITYIQY